MAPEGGGLLLAAVSAAAPAVLEPVHESVRPGTEGARIRASLTAKASALRTHQLTAAETAAQSATERMSLPVVLLFAGFLTFIAYPAVSHVLTTL